jgi:hypothetical protein
MKYRSFFLSVFMAAALLTACAPATPTQPAVDVVGTRAMELAALMMTQTVAAYSPTPEPTFTPEPTSTPTIEPTAVEIHVPKVRNDLAGCFERPDTASARISNISIYEEVELLAVGKNPGWYKITNPYFGSACWIEEKDLDIDGNMDLSIFPIE